jgi:uncharacterized protein involved in exopolysaccharide biosynthesis
MLDLLRILLHWRRPLLAFTLVAAVVAAIVAWNLTPRYYSQASILPPAEDNAAFGKLSSLLQDYQIPIPGGVRTPFLPTLYAAMIRSHKMAMRIVDEFELRPVFGTHLDSQAAAALRSRTFLKYTDEKILLVGYEDTDPERAAAVVNAYVRYLDEFIREANSTRAGDTRQFVEGLVSHCKSELEAAEEALKEFQRGHGAIEIDAQTQGALEIAGEIQGRILALEAELDLMRQYARASAPEVQVKERELRSLRESYARLLGSSQPEAPDMQPDAESEELFPKFAQVPDLALRYMRLLREVKVQTTLYTMLLQQREQARIEEQKNTRVLSVLDWAVPADVAVFPRKMQIVALAALAAFVWVALIAVFVEKLRARREDAAEAAQLAALQREWHRMPAWVRSLERLVVKSPE